jgi:hypothetical protein
MCACRLEDAFWYRCEIISKLNKKYFVRLIDFGDIREISPVDMKVLHKE